MRQIIIFGASKGGKKVLKHLGKDDRVLFFADNDSKKHAKTIKGKRVIPPEDITFYEFDTVFIASLYSDEIRSQLLEMGIDENKIEISSSELLDGEYDFPRGCLPTLILMLFSSTLMISLLSLL